MQQFMITWEADLAPGDDVVECLDEVMAQLIECEDVIDPTIGYDSDAQVVEFEFAVEADDVLDAVGKAAGLLRAGLHAALIATPHWPDAGQIANAFKFAHGPSSVDALEPA